MIPYRYSPLELTEKSIRILRLEKGKWFNDIKCHLFESFLGEQDGSPYKALSYTWGGLDGTAGASRILLDGQEFSVTDNLYSALRHIRRRDEDVTLWVDAICINQQDDDEKGHQVNQMGGVYKAAEEVIIWLGPDADGIGSLFELISWIDTRAHEAQAAGSKENWDVLHRRFLDQKLNPIHVETLAALLKRPWFQRIWVLQEVAHARTATITCGMYTCPARTFAFMPSLMRLEVDEHTQAVLDIMPRFRKDSWWASRRNLHFLLQKFQESQATDSRDKVYALLGMSDDACDSKTFYPSYTSSSTRVLQDTTSFLLLGKLLDPAKNTFPEFILPQLCQPIIQIAVETLFWALTTPRTAYVAQDRFYIPTDGIIVNMKRDEGAGLSSLEPFVFRKKRAARALQAARAARIASEESARGWIMQARSTATHLIRHLNGSRSTDEIRQLVLSLARNQGQVKKVSRVLDHENVRLRVDFLDGEGRLQVSCHGNETSCTECVEELPNGAGSPERCPNHRVCTSEHSCSAATTTLVFLGHHPPLREIWAFPLPFPIHQNMEEEISKLIKAGSSREAILRAYAWAGNEAGAMEQLSEGADLHHKDANGCTAMHLAVRGGNLRLVHAFLSHVAGRLKDIPSLVTGKRKG